MPFVGWTLLGTAVLLLWGVVKGESPGKVLSDVLKTGKYDPTADADKLQPVNVGSVGTVGSAVGSVGGASSGVTGARATIMAFGQAQLGKKYVWGATGPDSYDCSGLTEKAYAAAGISIPRVSAMQALGGQSVSSPQVGDIVYFGTPVHHVALWAGNNQILEAYASGYPIRIAPMRTNEHYGFRDYVDSKVGQVGGMDVAE